MLSREQFNEFAEEGYTHVPLMREVLADFDTPLSTYCRLARKPHTYLFESVQGGEKWGRYSMIGLPSATRIEVHGKEFTIVRNNQVIERKTVENPLAEIREFRHRFKMPELEDLPKFTGGLVGFFGYDTVRYVEPTLGNCPNIAEFEAPDICLFLSDEVVVFDNLSGRLFLIVHACVSDENSWESGQSRLDDLTQQLREPMQSRPALSLDVASESEFESSFGQGRI